MAAAAWSWSSKAVSASTAAMCVIVQVPSAAVLLFGRCSSTRGWAASARTAGHTVEPRYDQATAYSTSSVLQPVLYILYNCRPWGGCCQGRCAPMGVPPRSAGGTAFVTARGAAQSAGLSGHNHREHAAAPHCTNPWSGPLTRARRWPSRPCQWASLRCATITGSSGSTLRRGREQRCRCGGGGGTTSGNAALRSAGSALLRPLLS
jgi:hypothetical protein